MAEYGLTLPEHDLTPQEFKELARRLGRAAFVPLFLKFYERIVTGEATIEEQRKALVDISRWTGVEEERKHDPNANLPVFNFVFGVGGRVDAELVQSAEPVEPPTLLAPEDVKALDAIIHPPEPRHGQDLSPRSLHRKMSRRWTPSFTHRSHAMARTYPHGTKQMSRSNPLSDDQSGRLVPERASDSTTAPLPPGPRPYPFVMPPLPKHLQYKMECPSHSEPRRK